MPMSWTRTLPGVLWSSAMVRLLPVALPVIVSVPLEKAAVMAVNASRRRFSRDSKNMKPPKGSESGAADSTVNQPANRIKRLNPLIGRNMPPIRVKASFFLPRVLGRMAEGECVGDCGSRFRLNEKGPPREIGGPFDSGRKEQTR